ncbi:MAG: hypothetical protein E6H07_12180 [Bacteroidetes bacterium]|nr:MAG: hypothetical protein E6H07_12180 [Bacteroidota bacterium]
MYKEVRKIHLIEEVLKITNEGTLSELETVLRKSKRKSAAKKKKPSIYDFVGILSGKEADKMKSIIEETCEIIPSSRGLRHNYPQTVSS